MENEQEIYDEFGNYIGPELDEGFGAGGSEESEDSRSD